MNPVIVRLHRIFCSLINLPVWPICAPDEPKDPKISQRILNETKVLEKRLARGNQRNTKLLKTILNYTEKKNLWISDPTLGNPDHTQVIPL